MRPVLIVGVFLGIGLVLSGLYSRVGVTPPVNRRPSSSAQNDLYSVEAGDESVATAEEAVAIVVDRLPSGKVVVDSVARRTTLRAAEGFHGIDSSFSQSDASHLDRPVWIVGVIVDEGIAAREANMLMDEDSIHPGFYIILDASDQFEYGTGVFDESLEGFHEIEEMSDTA